MTVYQTKNCSNIVDADILSTSKYFIASESLFALYKYSVLFPTEINLCLVRWGLVISLGISCWWYIKIMLSLQTYLQQSDTAMI